MQNTFSFPSILLLLNHWLHWWIQTDARSCSLFSRVAYLSLWLHQIASNVGNAFGDEIVVFFRVVRWIQPNELNAKQHRMEEKTEKRKKTHNFCQNTVSVWWWWSTRLQCEGIYEYSVEWKKREEINTKNQKHWNGN